LLDEVWRDAAPVLPPPQVHALELALHMREVVGPPPDRATIAVGFLNALRHLASQGPLVVAIDDIQWLDAETLAVVSFAVRRLASEPILVLACVRSEHESGGAAALETTFADGRVEHLHLRPLRAALTHELIRKRLGRTFAPSELTRIHRASRGNPFLALEIARVPETLSEWLSAGQSLVIPPSVSEILDRRLDDLPARVQRVLEVVAITPEPTIGVVGQAAMSENDVFDLVEGAVAASVLTWDGERLRFTHPLLAERVSERMAPPRRRKLHRMLASLIREEESRARHLALGTGRPRESVATVAESGAKSASERGAPAAAAELCEQAMRLTPNRMSAALHRRKFQAAVYHLTSGATVRGRTLLEELRTELPAGGERADVLRYLAFLAIYDRQSQLALIEQAVAEAAGDDVRLSRIHHGLGMWWLSRGDIVHALTNLRTALALADAIGDRNAAALALTELLFVEEVSAKRTPGLVDRGLAFDHEGTDFGPGYGPRLALSYVRLCEGRFSGARSLLDDLLADSTAQGNEPNRMNCLCAQAEVECRAGNWTAAIDIANEACELSLQVVGALHPWPLFAKALALGHLGRLKDAREVAGEGLAIAENADIFQRRVEQLGVLGFLMLSEGDAVAADGILRPLVRELADRGWAIAPLFPSGDPIEALIAVDELDSARELVDQFEAEATALASEWLTLSAKRIRGLLCAAHGDFSEAVRHFEQALALGPHDGWRFERARTFLSLGTTQRRAKQRRAARQSLESARALFEQLGAPLWAERTSAELSRISGRPARSAELTPTERRVAELVVAGRTNSETAAALFVSRHTVEGHLSRIYTKLGVRSRTELAHRLAITASLSADTSTQVGSSKVG
jgi:DNA-binding CsgD family transcriptional regulator